MKTLSKIAALALPVLVAGAAFADEPLALSDAQMDGVNAGASAFAEAFADALGSSVATASTTLAEVLVVDSFSSELTTINLHSSLSSAAAVAQAN